MNARLSISITQLQYQVSPIALFVAFINLESPLLHVMQSPLLCCALYFLCKRDLIGSLESVAPDYAIKVAPILALIRISYVRSNFPFTSFEKLCIFLPKKWPFKLTNYARSLSLIGVKSMTGLYTNPQTEKRLFNRHVHFGKVLKEAI